MTATQELPIPTQLFPAHDSQKTPPDYQFTPLFAMPLSSPTAGVMPIVETATSESSARVQTFDPATHINFTPPDNTLLMKDLGYSDDTGISPVAVSDPFQLFSPEAIQQMRAEIFNPEVSKEHGCKSNLAASQLRGYVTK
jgi:hypothetical protein